MAKKSSTDYIGELGRFFRWLHLAHKHQSKDENLGRYTNPVRKRHFKALRRLERKLSAVFTAAGHAQLVRPSNLHGQGQGRKKSGSFGSRACRPR